MNIKKHEPTEHVMELVCVELPSSLHQKVSEPMFTKHSHCSDMHLSALVYQNCVKFDGKTVTLCGTPTLRSTHVGICR